MHSYRKRDVLSLLLLYSGLKAAIRQYEVVPKNKKKGPFSMDYREQRSHVRGVYLTQDTSRMRTARVMQDEEADTRIPAEE